MAISQLESPKFKAVYAAGATSGTPGEALASGRIFVTTTGGTYTNSSDRQTVYDDKAKTTEATRDADGAIALDSSGEVELWFDGVVDIRVESTTEELQYTLVGVESSPTATITGNYNLVQNGSFEIDSDSDGAPDSWTLATETSGTIAVDATSGGQNHGTQGLKFTGAGAGAGTATSTLFDVPDGGNVTVQWSFKQADAATGTYTIILEFYDYNGDATSNSTVWSSTSGAPTAWTPYVRTDEVPSGSTQAKLRLTGLENGGTDEIGSCWFDGVSVSKSNFYPDPTSPIATTSGTSHSVTLPTNGVNKFTVSFNGVSTDGANNVYLRLGDASGVKSSGYNTVASQLTNAGAVALTNGTTLITVRFTNGANAGDTIYGDAVFILADRDTNTWSFHWTTNNGNGYIMNGCGLRVMDSELTTVQLACADTFDAGSITINYEA